MMQAAPRQQITSTTLVNIDHLSEEGKNEKAKAYKNLQGIQITSF